MVAIEIVESMGRRVGERTGDASSFDVPMKSMVQ